jgi:tetratricopeptide (TPR) repeat protein
MDLLRDARAFNTSMRKAFVLISLVIAAQKFDIQGEVVTSNRVATPILVRLFKGTTLIQQMMTDDRGKFRFRKVDPGSYTIHAECEGYYAQDLSVQVTDSLQPVSISLEPVHNDPAVTASFNPFREFEIPRQAKKEFEEAMRDQKSPPCEKALPHLQKAIELYPRYGEAFTEMGRCYLLRNNPAAAEEALKKAVQFTPEIYPSVNLATLYVNQGRLDEAEELITRLLPKNQAQGDLYGALARIYFAKGRIHDAEVAGLEAHARGHRSADVHLILAKIYEDQHNRAALLTQLLTYLDEDPRGAKADEVRKQLRDLQTTP